MKPPSADHPGGDRRAGARPDANRRRLAADFLTLAIVFTLLGSAYLLPQDTSLSRVREAGVLRACLPESYPPLVTEDPQRPGIDVEILRAVAEEMDLRLGLNTNTLIGRDFNPRNWRLSRSQCQIVAGGVIDSIVTRSFLSVTPAHLETGWAVIVPDDLDTLQGKRVGFFAAVTGLDRISLASYLRRQGATVAITGSRAELAAGLEDGTFDAAVSESFTARQVASAGGWEVQWLPADLGRYPFAFGLWKGDLTLELRVERALMELEASGRLEMILESYDLATISEECIPCSPT